MWYDNLKNKRLWSIFEQIEQIPRESGNEEGVRCFLSNWAKEHNLESIIDKVGNVIIKVPATKGYENLPSIALQGHMDMVCVKREGSKHDFTKDPIEVVAENGIIHAKDTSLGADNGIAIALILDIFSDPESEHGPLEGIFTVSEETGLTGAFGIEEKNIQSRRLLNLDSEEEGIFYIGCAGGIEIDANKKEEWLDVEDGQALKIKVSGCLGGHSGGEIHKQRANAIHILGRALNRIPAFRLSHLDGGTRRNVIPSSAEAIIVVEDKENALSIIKELQNEISSEFAISDPDIHLEALDTELPKKALKKNRSEKIADMLFIAPHGVKAMSMALPGIVETSCNLAIASLNDTGLSVIWSVRSSVESAKLSLAYEIQTLANSFGLEASLSGGYPAWQPDVNSSFTKEVADAYEKQTGKKPVITAIHAGLECGIINKAIEGMDSLSIGPNLFDVHSVNEHVEIDSAERVADFVKTMLRDIK